jgi:hypothetical protein
MSDIRKYINLVESAQTAVDEGIGDKKYFGGKPKARWKESTKELGTDYLGNNMTARIVIHTENSSLSQCDIVVDAGRFRDSVAYIIPGAGNTTSDVKGPWAITHSHSDSFKFINKVTCDSLTKAIKEVVNQLKTHQRDISDERSYGRGRDGERF